MTTFGGAHAPHEGAARLFGDKQPDRLGLLLKRNKGVREGKIRTRGEGDHGREKRMTFKEVH